MFAIIETRVHQNGLQQINPTSDESSSSFVAQMIYSYLYREMGAAGGCLSKKKPEEQQNQQKDEINQERSFSKNNAAQNPAKQNDHQQFNLLPPGPPVINPQSRVDIPLPTQQDRSRISKISASKMKPVSQSEWAYAKNGSKITVKKQLVEPGKKSRIAQALPEQQLKEKLVKSFTVQIGTDHKQLVRNSDYLDESLGKIEDMDPTADHSLANFQMDDIRTMGVPMIKTFLYDQRLGGRLIE